METYERHALFNWLGHRTVRNCKPVGVFYVFFYIKMRVKINGKGLFIRFEHAFKCSSHLDMNLLRSLIQPIASSHRLSAPCLHTII